MIFTTLIFIFENPQRISLLKNQAGLCDEIKNFPHKKKLAEVYENSQIYDSLESSEDTKIHTHFHFNYEQCMNSFPQVNIFIVIGNNFS